MAYGMSNDPSEKLLLRLGKECRHCGAPMHGGVSVCRTCGGNQHRFVTLLNLGAQAATVASAVVTLGLLVLTYWAQREASATLQIAKQAQERASGSEHTANSSAARLEQLRIGGEADHAKMVVMVQGAERLSHRLTRVETVMTQVDLESGGRKVCIVGQAGTFNAPGELTLYVPSTWTAAACQQLAKQEGRFDYRLGCVFENSSSFGWTQNGRESATAIAKANIRPEHNCGWSFD
jgi:hypothetical protein